MLKGFRVLTGFDNAIQQAVDNIVDRIIDFHGDLKGREEEVSHQLASEITFHLMDEIQESLHGRVINGVRFEVYSYKKREENVTGADLAGFVEINHGEKQIKKIYLAQAKVCNIRSSGSKSKKNTVFKYDTNIQKQAKKMINITSDSYFFLYSNRGIDVIPALEVYSSGKNLVDTSKHYYISLKDFYEKFFTCFIGDHKVAPYIRNIDELQKISEEFKVKNVLYIKVSIPESSRND